MDDFFPEHKEKAQVTNKKRKAEKQPADDYLRNKARFYCTCPEQWRSVSRYSAERLSQFVQENEFKEQQHLQNQVFDFIQRGLGYLIDKFSGANGFVSEQIENDQSLRSAIQQEAGNFVSLLNNKVKLLALLATDTMTGKLNQNLQEPQIVEITQEIKNGNNASNFFGETTGQEEAQMPTGGEVPGDPVCAEAFGDAGGWTQRDGQIADDSLDVEGPSGTEVDLR
jgi:hypothetical protein